ncbi:MAG: hypothetical protein IPJ02_18085, partial [Chitinophagaceae bacterium]|nr:hypothetical protein [Chitinophagaceae bacterium]
APLEFTKDEIIEKGVDFSTTTQTKGEGSNALKNKNKKNEPIKKQQSSSKETGGSSTKVAKALSQKKLKPLRNEPKPQ